MSVILISKENKKFTVSQSILTSKNEYFTEIFKSHLKKSDSKQSDVKMNLSSKILQAVIEYYQSEKFEYTNRGKLEDAEHMVRMRHTAYYLGDQQMYGLCTHYLGNILRKNVKLACYVIEVLRNEPRTYPDQYENLYSTAIDIIDNFPFDCILPYKHSKRKSTFVSQYENASHGGKRVEWLSYESLNELMEDLFYMKDHHRFMVIEEWYNYKKGKNSNLRKSDMFIVTDRLSFEIMPFDFLCHRVEPSGLVRAENLKEAYKSHAQRTIAMVERLTNPFCDSPCSSPRRRKHRAS